MIGGLSRRPLRRLLVALAALVVLDPFVPGVVQRLETARYESDRLFRFENSDLFALGPLVQYLRERPTGARPRVVFFGNSVVWGYFLAPDDSVPAQLQRLTPGARVLNLAVNGFETGSAYVITKQIIDAVDTIYLFAIGVAAHPMLPRLMTVEPEDRRRFGLTTPDAAESPLARALDVWKLSRDAYRLQAAVFGTSTRVFAYRHKTWLAGAIWRSARGAITRSDGDHGVRAPGPVPRLRVVTPVAPGPVSDARRRELAGAYPLLWDYAALVRTHRKRGVIVDIGGSSTPIGERDRADLNAIFLPEVSFVTLSIPTALTVDGQHPSAEGARAVAQALHEYAPPMTAVR